MAKWCRRQLLINEMTIDAVLEGTMKTVYQLFALDPMVTDLNSAVKLADGYIRSNREYFQTFR
jgi:alpha-galactosidase/6-phospho-beta-glucosidase family protein